MSVEFMLADENGQDIEIGTEEQAIQLANARNEPINLYRKEYDSTYWEAMPCDTIYPNDPELSAGLEFNSR